MTTTEEHKVTQLAENVGVRDLGADQLLTLVDRAWDAWDEANQALPAVVVQPSMPILYFGDAVAYAQSAVRVVTVALNPSLAEFPAAEPFRRFPAAPRDRPAEPQDQKRYLQSLDDYFRHDPYRNWFDSLEPLLMGMGASFYGDAHRAVAVHTDLCTPVPTHPTWSGLPDAARRHLIRHGRPLWTALIRELLPHVVLVSVARAHLREIEFVPADDWTLVHKVERTNPYLVTARRVRINEAHTALLVYGRAAQKPFGLLSHIDKRKTGRVILEHLDV